MTNETTTNIPEPQPSASPYRKLFDMTVYAGKTPDKLSPARLTVSLTASGNVISTETCKRLGLHVEPYSTPRPVGITCVHPKLQATGIARGLVWGLENNGKDPHVDDFHVGDLIYADIYMAGDPALDYGLIVFGPEWSKK